MTEDLLHLEQSAHQCTTLDLEGPQELRKIIHKIYNLIEQHYRGGDGSEVLNDVLNQLREAEQNLDHLKPEEYTVNDWKYNLQAFSNAKAAIQYSLNRMKAAIRFDKLHLAV